MVAAASRSLCYVEYFGRQKNILHTYVLIKVHKMRK
jgi:hypothetical protein